jgi:hypothetical protein
MTYYSTRNTRRRERMAVIEGIFLALAVYVGILAILSL